jgi:hypothetical protein
MGVKHAALTVLLCMGAVAVSGRAIAITLGELQARPSHPPPYVFRLAILSAPHGSLDIPAVTVRQPQDALSFVKNNTLELQLRSLTDVELEVSHAGQTLNRLLMKHEFQAARAPLEAALAWDHYQTAKAKGAPRLRLAALLDTAYQSYQAWRQFDPTAARHPLAQVTRERLRFLAESPRHADPTGQEAPPGVSQPPAGLLPGAGTDGAAGRTVLERETEIIREAMHELMVRVTPWPETEGSRWPGQGGKTTSLVPLLLGGVFIAGLTSLFTSHLMQRSLANQARRRRRVLVEAARLAGAEHTPGPPRLGEGQMTQFLMRRSVPPQRAAVVRHLRVSHKIKRRIRLRPRHVPRESPPPRVAEHAAAVAPISLPRALAPAELSEALGNLRQALLHLRHQLPPSSTGARTDSSLARRAR